MSNDSWKPEVFESLFEDNPDPWDFENSLYERQKLEKVLECLSASPVSFALELGCAIGVSTLALSRRCERLLAVDVSQKALALAKHRCRMQKHVSFLKAFLPADYPTTEASGCDLVIISEILYFLAQEDIRRLVGMVTENLVSTGHILIVNWTGQTDTPCTGDEAAECFIRNCHERRWWPDLAERGEGYRIERLSCV
ncbi:class I SAM-dependent DNA methyltransferase [Acetobacter sp.]|uniref:class I SAM-dependent DNA methyltransferase n=1 Tax=Acetobacter sp. TaxID=440 RepID=UPI0039EC0002